MAALATGAVTGKEYGTERGGTPGVAIGAAAVYEAVCDGDDGVAGGPLVQAEGCTERWRTCASSGFCRAGV